MQKLQCKVRQSQQVSPWLGNQQLARPQNNLAGRIIVQCFISNNIVLITVVSLVTVIVSLSHLHAAMVKASVVTTWNINRRKWLPHLKVLTKKDSSDWVRASPSTPEKALLLRKTWLGFRCKKGAWTAGCEVCSHCKDKEARAFRSFGVTTLAISNLKRHQKSEFHKRNVQRLMGKTITNFKAPSESQFLRVWDELSKGVAPNSVNVDNMKGDKIYRMVFACLKHFLQWTGSLRRMQWQDRSAVMNLMAGCWCFFFGKQRFTLQKWDAWCQKRPWNCSISHHCCPKV